MKRLNITFGIILLVLGCFAFSPAAKADPPIAGLWHEHYTSTAGGPPFETYSKRHSDVDRYSFDGTYDQKFFDANGNQVAEDMGTITRELINRKEFASDSSVTATR
jgi:hypothetical protein